MKTLSILLTTESLGPGGAERQLTELAKGLSIHNDFKLSIVSFSRKSHYDDEVEKCSPLFRISDRYDVWRLSVLRNLMKAYDAVRPQIVHSFLVMDSIYVYLLSYFRDFVWINGSIRDTIGTRDWQQYAKKKLLKLAPYVVANSHAGLEHYGFKADDRHVVIHNGIDVGRFSRANSDSPREFSICSVANFSSYKDHWTLLKAFKIIADRNVRLYLVGDGKFRPEYESYVRSENLSGKVIFLGRQTDVEQIISNMDLGVLCSYKQIGEGFPNAVLEFMASGVPVIASNVGGVKEIIRDGINGFVVDPESPKILAERIQFTMDNMAQMRPIIETAFVDVKTRYSSEIMAEKYANFYRSIA
ncbi:MAG TPA: glycosyltransferase family 4 protein [Candidatus Acidoferrales bacterium]|nr:glycosyltransferase family 4 protein [Candidatus Acidoferrales bacterium]